MNTGRKTNRPSFSHGGMRLLACMAACLIQLAGSASASPPWQGEAGSQDDWVPALEEEFLLVEDTLVQASTRGQEHKRRVSPMAVTVITREEIRRSGAQDLPALLRRVTGLEVARVAVDHVTVAPRGNLTFRDGTVLVLIDGVSYFEDFFGQIRWSMLPVVLEDIERIEIVRGPAGALFGANASRGVIAISTRRATDAGGSVVTGYGSRATRYARASHAFGVEDDWYLKVVGSWEESHTFETPALGIRAGKGLVRGAGRLHARRVLGEDRSLEAILGLVEASKTTRVSPPGAIDGLRFYEASLLYEQPGTRLMSSWNGMEAEAVLGSSRDLIKQKKGILTLEQDLLEDEDTSLMAGFDLRFLHLETRVSVARKKGDLMAAVFARFETHLGEDLHVHATARLEKEPARGRVHLVPNLSLVQELGESHSVRITAGRGFRNPGSVATYGDFPFFLSSGIIRIVGDRDLVPEKQDTIELGYEGRFGNRFSFSAAAFHNWLHDLIATRLAAPGPPPVLRFSNMDAGRTFGVELETRFSPWKEVRSYLSYVFLESLGSAEELTTPHTLKAGLTARFLEQGILDLNYSLLSHRREESLGALAPPPGAHSSSSFLSGRLSYQLWKNGPELGLNVWNGFDQDDPELFGAGRPERRVSLDLRMDF